MTGLVFEKGARLRLTRAALDQLYPRRYRDKTWRDAAARKRFIVVGWSRDGRCTRVIVEGGSPNNTPTYYTGFLERL